MSQQLILFDLHVRAMPISKKKDVNLRAFKYQTRFLFLSLSQFQDIEIFFFYSLPTKAAYRNIKRVPGSLTTMECNIDGIITAFERDISRPLFAWDNSHMPCKQKFYYVC